MSMTTCPAGLTTTLILGGDQLALQVHESCGHPIELDRVLGTEAAFAGIESGFGRALVRFVVAALVLIAIVGTAGLQPALAAIRAGKDIAVASKEILVMAGEIVMTEARRHGVRVLAVDSEHSAIFQCLDGKPPASVRKLWLTASGGHGAFPHLNTDPLWMLGPILMSLHGIVARRIDPFKSAVVSLGRWARQRRQPEKSERV